LRTLRVLIKKDNPDQIKRLSPEEIKEFLSVARKVLTDNVLKNLKESILPEENPEKH
jgi:hypothetical protein